MFLNDYTIKILRVNQSSKKIKTIEETNKQGPITKSKRVCLIVIDRGYKSWVVCVGKSRGCG